MLNTKFDYEYIRDNVIDGWESQWLNLLEGRFIVVGDELVEDANAPIFRLGLTVEEVSQPIGFSGLTQRETAWCEAQPDRYQYIEGEFVKEPDTYVEVDGEQVLVEGDTYQLPGTYAEIDGWLAARKSEALAKALESKLLEIQREKCKVRDAGVTVGGVLFDTDSAAQGMYTQTLMMMQMMPGFVVEGWKASAGIYVDLDQTLLMGVLMSWKELINALTLKQAEKEAEVQALESSEAVEKYDASIGWL